MISELRLFISTLYSLITLGQKARPVFDGICHVAAVDIVKGGGIGPVGFYVVNLEVDVGRCPIWNWCKQCRHINTSQTKGNATL